MRKDITITRNNIPDKKDDKDKAAWYFYVNLCKEEEVKKEKGIKGNISAEFTEFAEKVNSKFNDVPKKMTWKNYLITEITESYIDYTIDNTQSDEICDYILQLAKEYGFVSFGPEEGVIHRPDEV